MPRSLVFLLLLVARVSGQTVADPAPPDLIETGLSPQEALARMTVPEGFTVDLVASEPAVTQPIAMCFDERGRIWIAEGQTYPRRAEEGEGKDRIVIFEDGDGDGSFETRKVFAEGLNLVSGMAVGFGGVFVGAAPYFQFIPDRDRDDRPDREPEILLDGFGYGDTHETLNSFTWGPDGWLYGCHGVFTYSQVGKPGTPDAQRIGLNAGVWRFHPVRREFEVFAHGTSNPWGVDFNDKGQCFIEACVIPHFWHMIQGGIYQRQGGQHFNPYVYTEIGTIADHVHYVGDIRDHAHWGHEKTIAKDVSEAGGGHAHCGLSIYLGDNFPDEYRNQPLFFNVHGHRINHDLLTRNGSGWKASHGPDLLQSHDKWFMGVALEYGPDGALYLIDWYDQTNCHRHEVERWDRSNGRIYRLRYEGWKPKKVDLWSKSSLELAKLQLHRNEWFARTARRILQERAADGKAMDPDATAFLNKILESDPDDANRLRALWCRWAGGAMTRDDLVATLGDRSEWLRAWAVQLLCEGGSLSPSELDAIQLAGTEASPTVKLYLASAAQRVPKEARWEIVSRLAATPGPDDPNLPQMTWYGLEPLVELDPPRALEVALNSPQARLVEFVVRRMRGEGWIEVVFEALREKSTTPEGQARLLEALLVRFEQEKKLPIEAKHGATLVALKASDSERVKAAAGRLAAMAGDATSLEVLWAGLEDRKGKLEERRAALAGIVSTGKERHMQRILKLLDDEALWLDILRVYPQQLMSPAVYRQLATASRERKLSALELMLENRLVGAFMTAVGSGAIMQPAEVPPHLVWRLRQEKDEATRKFVVKHWGEASEGDKAALEQIASWKKKLEDGPPGNPPQGRNEFRNLCGACHKLFGDGNLVGPDLTGANRQDLDYLLENILNPNALVGEGYELHSLTMKSGTVKVGMVAREDDTVVVLRGAGGDESVVRVDEIASREKLGISLMPPGLLSALSEEQVRDLISYLQSPRQVPLPPIP